jgi:hypothetical protein
LGHVEFAFALSAGIGFDHIDALERLDGLGRAYRLAIAAGGTFIEINIARAFVERDLKVPCFTFNAFNIRTAVYFDVDMPAELDQFR